MLRLAPALLLRVPDQVRPAAELVRVDPGRLRRQPGGGGRIVAQQGLERLEYRGYDSCGVAVHAASLNGGTGGLQRARSTARVAELMDAYEAERVRTSF